MTPLELKNAPIERRDGNLYIQDGDREICLMYGNEEEYIKESIRLICQKIKPLSVIELGFGLGFTAQQFQDEGVGLHIIYEPNDELYQDALKWAEGKEGVDVRNVRYQDNPIDTPVSLVYNDIYEVCDPYQGDYEFIKTLFNFRWYAEFCTDYNGEQYNPEHAFEVGGHNKLQLLLRND